MKNNSSKLIFILSILLSTTTINAQNCASNAGIDQTICITQTLNLTGIAGSPQFSPASVVWSKLSGPAATITTPNAATTTVTALSPGSYIFEFANKCADGLFARDNVVITVLPEPPTSLAGPDVSQCSNTAVALNANIVTAPVVGTWTVNPVGGSFSPNANAPNATYTPPAGAATYTLTWTLSNGLCSQADNMLINVVAPTLPVNAGTDITLSCAGSCATLNGSNPGIAPPQGGLWTLVSGPNTPIFTNPTIRNTQVCGLVAGTYTLRWTVSGPCGSGTDDMILNVTNVFDPPISGGNTYTNFCSTPLSTVQTLIGTPLAPGETGVWTLTSGQTGIAYSPNNTTATVSVSGLTGGFPYNFTFVKTNSAGCTATGTFGVYRSPGLINLTNPTDVELPCDATTGTFTMSYDNITNLQPGLSRSSTRLSGPASVGNAVYTGGVLSGSTRTDTWSLTGFTTAGTYVFRVGYFNACGATYRDIAITTSKTPGPINAGSDIVLPCNVLTANPIATSTSSGVGYNFYWTQVSGPNTATLSGVNTSSLLMSGLVQGVYKMRFNVSGGAKCPIRSDDMLVTVTQSVPTIATTGPNVTVCAGNYQLTANSPLDGQIGTWTVTPSAGIAFLPNSNTPTAIVTGMLATTAYTFKWTIANSCGSAFSNQVITTTAFPSPPVPIALPNLCATTGTTTVALPGSNPNGATVLWSSLDLGASVSPTNTQNTTATITNGNGTYRFVYALSTPGCTTLTDTVSVTIAPTVITANAGVDINICTTTLPATSTLTGNTIPIGSISTWSQTTGPSPATIVSPNSATTAINNLQAGVYEFEYRITSGTCADVVDIVQIRVTQSPTIANAGPDQSLCNIAVGTIVNLAATAPTVGTGYWQIVSSPPSIYASPAFSNQNSAISTLTFLTNGLYKLVWSTISGPGCPTSNDTVDITIGAVANAGADYNLCNVNTTTLLGSSNTAGIWSLVSGPAVSIATNSPNTATVNSMAAGTTTPNVYTFRYSMPAVGSCLASFDDVVVSNYPQPAQADAGPDKEICFNTTTLTLTGNVPGVGTGSWIRDLGPNTPAAGTANTNSIDTILNNLQAGLYVYRYVINSNAVCTGSFDKMQIVKEITANAKPDIRVCNSNTVVLNATPPLLNQGNWTVVSGPAGSSFSNINAPNSAVNGLVPGTYVFRWTIGSLAALICNPNFDDVQVIIDPPVAALNAGPDTTFCQSNVLPFAIGTLPSQAGVTYLWTPTLNLSATNIAQPTFNGINTSGSYTYTVKGTIGTCEAFDQMNINIKPKPSSAIAIGNVTCATTFNAIANTSGYSYNWTFDPTGSITTGNNPGPFNIAYTSGGTKTVKLVVTSTNGCKDSSTVSFTPNCVLPINFIGFNLCWKNNAPVLNWNIDELNSLSYFIVQRSFDGVVFNDIGTLSASGLSYNYIDLQIGEQGNNIYYRILAVEHNGKKYFSSIRNLLRSSKNNIIVYPNPFFDYVKLSILGTSQNEVVTIKILSIDGKLIFENVHKLNKGSNEIMLNSFGGITNAVYILQVLKKDKIETFKILKVDF